MFKFNKKNNETQETTDQGPVTEKEEKMEKKSSKKKLVVKVLAGIGIAAGALLAVALRGSSCTEECESLTDSDDAKPDPAESEFPGTEED